jgi:hypothetical protein
MSDLEPRHDIGRIETEVPGHLGLRAQLRRLIAEPPHGLHRKLARGRR